MHCQAIRKRKGHRVLDVLKNIIKIHELRGFKVVSVNGDNEFKILENELEGINLSTCDTNAHAPAIERTNRFLKEQTRCARSQMPFKHLPRRFIIKMNRQVTLLMNSIPRKGGAHDAMSVRELVLRKKLLIPKCCVGEYVIGHQHASNSAEEPRGFDELCLGRNNNGSGHIAFKLSTKRAVSVPRCTPMPMTDSVIKIVNAISKEENDPEGIEFGVMFGKVTINDIDIDHHQDEILQYEDEDDNASDASYEPSESDEDDDTLSVEIGEGDMDVINSKENSDDIDDHIECGESLTNKNSEVDNDSREGSDIEENESLCNDEMLDDQGEDNNEDDIDEIEPEVATKPRMRYEISSDGLDGPCWNNNSNVIGAMINDEDNNNIK